MHGSQPNHEAGNVERTSREDEVKDEAKTKGQLIQELTVLNQKITSLEASERECRRLQAELGESEERFRRFSEAAFEGIVIHEGGKILEASETLAMMLGYDCSEMIGRQASEVTAPEYHHLVSSNILAGHERPYEIQCLRKDGSTFPAEICGKAIPYHGRTARVTAVRDISERKLAEEATSHGDEYFRALIENVWDVINVVAEDGTITYVSPSVQRLFGYSPEEIVGKNVFDFIHQEDQSKAIKTLAREIRSVSTSRAHEVRFQGGDGCWRVVEATGKRIVGSSGETCIVVTSRDITERKQAEEALSHSEQQYRSTIDSMGDAIQVVDTNLCVTLVNSVFKQWLEGLGLEVDITGKSLFEAFPFLPDKVRSEYDKVFSIGEPITTEENTRIGSQEFDTETRKIPIFDHGRVSQVITVIRDISERKRAEEALRQAEHKLRVMFESIADGIIVTNLDGNIMETNGAAIRLYGYSGREELIGRSALDFINEKSNAGIEETRRRAFEEGLSGNREFKCLAKDSREFDAEFNAALLRNESGDATGFIAVIKDITERKRAEERLRESERRYWLLADNLTDGLWTADMNLRLTYISPSVTRLLGYSVEEAMPQTLEQILTPVSLEVTKKVFSKGMVRERVDNKDSSQTRTLQLEFNCRDGSTVWLDVKLAFLCDENGQPVEALCLAQDITGHKQRQQYVHLFTQAQEEERKRLARELHDETVQGLIVLALDIETTLRASQSFPDECVQSLRQIRDRVSHIAEELSRFSHALRPSVLDHLGLVPAVELLTDDLNRVGIATHIEVDGEERRLSPEVELGIFRIAQEACSNIRRHSHARTANVRLEFGPDGLMVTVADDGSGFELPKRLGSFAATGKMGLIGMQERAILLDSSLHIQSKVSRGTTVILEVGRGAMCIS